jgi:phosphomannomutase
MSDKIESHLLYHLGRYLMSDSYYKNEIQLSCFKAYDVRGKVPSQLDTSIVYRIGRAYARVLRAKTVVVGYDIRLTSENFCKALCDGLQDEGVDVTNIGCCGTEEVYFATFNLKMDGGIMITASHNPKDYNGLKFVRESSKPIHAHNGLLDIKSEAEREQPPLNSHRGELKHRLIRPAYIDHLLTYIDVTLLKSLRIVANPGNGGAGMIIKEIEERLPCSFIMINETPDGNFPHGVPNPLLIENREETTRAVVKHKAHFGIAWDGDFDRCFFFDEHGGFVEGYYLIGLFSEYFLAKHQGPGKVVHDPRLYWNTQSQAEAFKGKAIQSKTGHSYMKETMRMHDALYGGEMSAHHYFKEFEYCDSGMIPWLLMVAILSSQDVTLSSLVQSSMDAYPISGEINTVLKNPDAALQSIESHFQSNNPLRLDKTDGLSMDFEQWRFNIRKSNTEPVVRLNVESRGDVGLMQTQRDAILRMIKEF